MNILDNFNNQAMWQKLASLRKSIDKKRKAALQKRLTKQSHATDLEYLLGAFMEMYEPHLELIVRKLSQKGYPIDSSSGFGGKNSEFQIMTGDFSLDYLTRNKLEKIGVKARDYNGSQSLIFSPEKAQIDTIVDKWMQIIDVLPDKGVLSSPSSSTDAIKFRRKYIPQDQNLQKQRLFEKLKYKTQNKVQTETRRRQKERSHPNKIELILGFFIEEIEPQVRQAIIIMNTKGYSTDKSGFMNNPCHQMIEGDFLLDENTIDKLQKVEVTIVTNPSGYTRIQFSPDEADISRIRKKWNKIVSLLPDKRQVASSSMTRQAREFRQTYQF